MPRKYKPINCSKTDIIKLTQIASDNSNPRLAKRALIILRCNEGQQVKDIASELEERPNTVILWKNRFAEGGINSLINRPRGSNANKYKTDVKNQILSLLNSAPPDGAGKWTGTSISKELGIPPDVVWRFLRKEGLSIKTYPLFENKSDVLDTTFQTMDFQLRFIIRKDSSMNNNNISSPDNMDLEIVARIKGKDGTVIEKKVQLNGAIPNAADFDICTMEGFRSDFDKLEQSLIKARNDLTDEIAKEYMDEVSKKNKSRKKQ